MPFKPGKPKTGGRRKNVPNKLTTTVKETVLTVFLSLQNDAKHNLEAFAKRYPKDFYTIAAKLIPTEIQGQIDASITWNENKSYNPPKNESDV